MKKIKIADGYITDIELTCGKVIKLEVSSDKQPVSFLEEDAEEVKLKIEKHFQEQSIITEIVIEDV